MTTTSATTDRADLEAESAAIQAKRPDAIQSEALAHVSLWMTDAQVSTELVNDGKHLSVRLSSDGLLNEQNVYLDAVTAYRLFRALDDAVAVCPGCNRPGFVDDLDRCPVDGGHLHSDCHKALFSGSPTHQREGCFE